MRRLLTRRLVLVLATSALSVGQAFGQTEDLRVEPFPTAPYFNETRMGLELHNDFVISNNSARSATITRIELAVFDDEGRLAQRKFVSARNGGAVGGLRTIPRVDIAPGQQLTLFNPFYQFDHALEIGHLAFTFDFLLDGRAEVVVRTVEVRPTHREGVTSPSLPLQGRSIVWDGHDFYSHHRRQDLSRLPLDDLDMIDVPVRYAYDLCAVNDDGALYEGDSTEPTNWYSYGVPVYAPATGVVVSAANDVPDNRIEGDSLVYPDSPPASLTARLMGNHVVIDHGNGEYSWLAHLRPGSVTVGLGTRVERGDTLGEVGFSGDTGFHVHVHYHLTTGTGFFGGRALPVQFAGFRRALGERSVAVERGPIETGDVLIGTVR